MLSCTSNELPSNLDKDIEENLEAALTVFLCRKRMSDRITNKNTVNSEARGGIGPPALIVFPYENDKEMRRATDRRSISAIMAMRTGCPSCDMTALAVHNGLPRTPGRNIGQPGRPSAQPRNFPREYCIAPAAKRNETMGTGSGSKAAMAISPKL